MAFPLSRRGPSPSVNDKDAAAIVIPDALNWQRSLLRWLGHSFVTSVCSRFSVTVLKALPFLCFLVVARRAYRLGGHFRRMEKPFLRFAGRTALESWALFELGFWFYFRWKKSSLEARRAYQPSVLHKAPGERKALLRRVLANIDRIHTACATSSQTPAMVAQAATARHPRSPARSNSRSRLHVAPSVENFLRYQDALADEEFEAAPVIVRTKSKSRRSRSPLHKKDLQSVENLLRCRDSSELLGVPATPPVASTGSRSVIEVSAEELRCLKHLELCSWYRRLTPGQAPELCGDIREIGRGNVEEWILSYWFDGAENALALSAAERVELRELVDEVVLWADLGAPAGGTSLLEAPDAGKNAALKCFRLRNDPFPALHRPLFTYAITTFVWPALGNRSLTALGFRPYRSGSTEYWFRPPSPDEDWLRNEDGGRPRSFTGMSRLRPLVFCHGIGVGATMCLTFLQRVTQGDCGKHPIFLVDTAAISMRFCDNVPGAREVAANMVDMLEVWAFSGAHFVGHSFGSFLVVWMLRYQRSFVTQCTFLDPVCFLVLKVLAEGHELQQVRSDLSMDFMELGLKYFVMTELFVCNFVCRCFFWEECMLDMEDLDGIETLIVLESEDRIVPTHSVYRLALAETRRRQRRGRPDDKGGGSLGVLWVEGQPHAGFLVDAEACQQVSSRLSAFHGGEGLQP